MQLPALSVTVVASCPEAVEPRLVEALRREGIPLVEALAEAWPPTSAAAATSAMYLWFPGDAAGDGAADPALDPAIVRVAAWLDAQAERPAVLAIAATFSIETLLAAGLDDVAPRSISERELVARIRALHRRLTRRPPEGQLRFGALTIDTIERAAWMDGAIVSITPIEQAVLVTLIRARGRALTRLALLEAAWSDVDFEISERAVDNVILRLRRKLPRPEVIETVRGVGFRLAGGDRELQQ